MPAAIAPPPPRALPESIAALRTDLIAAEYTVERTEQLLGPLAVSALRRENPLPARRALAERTESAAALLAVFTLGETITAQRVDEVLPTLGSQGALELGILMPDAPAVSSGRRAAQPAAPEQPLLRAAVDLSPYSATDDAGEISWWIASDLSELATGRTLSGEHVLGVGGASLTLARLTPREKVGTVLDLGCGGGIQAMHASRHADHVVATDLSERALAFAAFTTALNEIDVELRRGSLLEPVAGDSFDLIISNPPFVITPRSESSDGTDGYAADGTWTYRDGGRAGDTLLAELLAQLPEHLAPGGRAVMLGNWEISADGAFDDHPRAWLEPALDDGVDCWVIQRESEDPAQYAETWARDGGVTERDARWPELLTAWLDDFASRQVEQIGFGYLLLHRPSEPRDPSRGVLRTEEVASTGTGTLAAHLAASLTAIDQLARLDDAELAALRPRRAADVVERRHLTPGAWDPTLIELVQGAGLGRSTPADQALAASVGALDGTLTLEQTIGAVCALTDEDPEETTRRLMPRVRELVTVGMLEI